MKKTFPLLRVSAFVGSLLCAGLVVAQQPAATTAPTAAAADNTRVNTRDRNTNVPLPTDQPNNSDDIRVAAAVRRAIVADKSLSVMAHNVKLVAAAGTVTLRGPVNTAAEKDKVQKLAANVAGVTAVNNELDIKH